MWNKKIFVTNHAIRRFYEREIKFSKKITNPIKQILHDLKPLNIREREKIEKDVYKITTNEGKVYIVIEKSKYCFVQTVYTEDIKFKVQEIRSVKLNGIN